MLPTILAVVLVVLLFQVIGMCLLAKRLEEVTEGIFAEMKADGERTRERGEWDRAPVERSGYVDALAKLNPDQLAAYRLALETYQRTHPNK